jgi:DNA-binding MurR/RpiR family transcriptional regulator
MKKMASIFAVQTADAAYEPLRDRLLSHVNGLSRQQRLIADYLLDHLQEVPFLSVPQLAERAGASEATVVRFCRSIGFKGFSDMKMAVVESLREELRSPGSPAGDPAAGDVLTAVAELEHHNINRTLESIDRRTFRQVAGMLHDADHVFTFGLGISAQLAELASYLMTEHGLRANRLSTHFTSPREQLVTMRPGDVLLVFSFPPYSRQTLEMLEEARERGMRTVAITDRAAAPAVALAHKALRVSSHGMTFTNATSSTTVLLNALAVEIASHHRDDTVDALSRINRILSEGGLLVEGDD